MSGWTLHMVTDGLDEQALGALCHGLGAGDVVVLVGEDPISSLIGQGASPTTGGSVMATGTWRAYGPLPVDECLPGWLELIDAQQWARLVEQCDRTMTWSFG